LEAPNNFDESFFKLSAQLSTICTLTPGYELMVSST